jgi:hypothetical protein
MTTDIVTLPGTSNEFSLTRFMPRDLTELVKFSEYASKSGVFGQMSPAQALIIMLNGAELGINPLQALREIPLVNGKPRPSATLVAGLIQRSPLCEDWSLVSSPTSVTLKAKRKGRGSEFIVNVRIEDVPASLKSKDVWKQNPEDMLVARAIHRMARRAFADILAGIQDADEIDETRVIDVGKVEREVGDDFGECPACGGKLFLQASRNGGAFTVCDTCARAYPPPQHVRDAVRGTPSHLTLAAASEPVLAPGEREITQDDVISYAIKEAAAAGFKTMPTPQQAREALEAALVPGERTLTPEEHEALTLLGEGHSHASSALESEPLFNDAAPGLHASFAEAAGIDATESAVQSEYDGERPIDAEPAGADDALIPEPVDPKAANQAMRNAIYSHWIKPRPTAQKIELRGLLEDFGWTGGDTLADWLLPLSDDKLAAIADAVAGVA